MDCHLLIYFCFLIAADLLTSSSMFLVLYIIVFKYSIFNLLLDLDIHVQNLTMKSKRFMVKNFSFWLIKPKMASVE